MNIRSLIVTAVLATTIFCSGGAVSAQAVTDNSALIAQLQSQIATLMAQILALQGQQGTTTGTTWCYTFDRNLGFAESGTTDVSFLHAALKKQNISYGSDADTIYTEATAIGVRQFQAKYGLIQTGYVGAATRAELNSLYECSTIPPACLNGAGALLPGQSYCSSQPSITVTSPVGGETWKTGETHTITWTSQGASAVNYNVQIGLLDMRYGNEDTDRYENTIAYSIPNTGSYAWTIPQSFGGFVGFGSVSQPVYKIVVHSWSDASTGVALAGTSNSSFTIIAPTIGATTTLGTPTLIASLSTPSQYIAASSSNATQAAYNFFVASGSSTIITELKFSATNNTVANICFGTVCAAPINGVADLTGLQLAVPGGAAGTIQSVQVSYVPVGIGGLSSGTTSQVALTYVGYIFGGTSQSIATNVPAPMVTLVGSTPTFTYVNSTGAPATGLIIGSKNQIGQVTISASSKGAIKVRQINFTVSGPAGFTLSSPSLAIGNTTISGSSCAWSSVAGAVVCTFNSGLTSTYATDYAIPAGQSQTFSLYATVGGTLSGSPSISTSLVAGGTYWDDSSTNGTSGTGLSANLIYNFPTTTYTTTYVGNSQTQPQPSIISITPTQGGSGTNVTISGTNLSGASSVGFYRPGQTEASASVVVLSATSNSVNFTIGAGFDGMVDAGVYQVVVVTPSGTSNNLSFTHILPTNEPSITVTSPNRGEQWQIGSTHNITWNVQSTYNFNTNIYLASALDMSHEWLIATSASSVANAGNTFTWTVGSATPFVNTVGLPPSGNYFISVCRAAVTNVTNGGEDCDYSDNYFTITAPATAVNGVCGSANGTSVAVAPSANLCSVGTTIGVAGNATVAGMATTSWSWTCAGSNGGASASCSATATTTPLALSCSASPSPVQIGSSATFTASASGGTGSYTYSWSGACTGTSQTCSNSFSTLGTQTASVTATSGSYKSTAICNVNSFIPGGCGTAAKSYSYLDGTLLGTWCLSGNPTPSAPAFPAQGGTTTWTCPSSTGGIVTCTATRSSAPAVVQTALTATCSPSVTSATVGQPVTWSATNVSGGTGTGYTYSWSGSGTFSGIGSAVTNTYTVAGTKTTYLTVDDSAYGFANITCPTISVNTTPACLNGTGVLLPGQSYCSTQASGSGLSQSIQMAVSGACGSAQGTSTATAPSANLCSTGTASSPAADSGYWTWTCMGSNGGIAASCTATIPAPVAVAPPCGILAVGATLTPGNYITSCNGSYKLVLQADGNAVVYNASNVALWNSHTQGKSSAKLVLQADGNLVIYGANGAALWASGSSGKPTGLNMQSDGNLVIYDTTGKVLWASNTAVAASSSSSQNSLASISDAIANILAQIKTMLGQ